MALALTADRLPFSTRLVHGGLRYLELLDFGLVRQDMREREILIHIAPRLVRPQEPRAWLFFIPFIVVSTFVVLNLFIGLIVESIQSLKAQREGAQAMEARAEAHADAALLLEEIRALRREVAALREARGGG